MIGLMLTQSVEVLAAAVRTSRTGEDMPDWSQPTVVATVRGWVQPRSGGDEELTDDHVTGRARAYLMPDAPVTHANRLRVGLTTWAVSGTPRPITTPRGEHHLEVDVELQR